MIQSPPVRYDKSDMKNIVEWYQTFINSFDDEDEDEDDKEDDEEED